MDKLFFCKYCAKEIWAIADIKYKLGVELPTLLHSVCYEELLENRMEYLRMLNNVVRM